MDFDIIKDELTFADLVRGKTFEFDGNRDDFDSELYDQLDEDEIEHIQEESTKLNPWQHKFFELKQKMTEVSEGGIFKKTIRDGIESRPIPDIAMVKIHYNAYFEGQSNAFDSTYMRGSPLTFSLGKGTVLQGVEVAIRSMKVEEESLFIIPWTMMYGKIGCAPRIPPKADALFVLRILECRAIALPGKLKDLTEFYQRYYEANMMDTTAKRAFKNSNFVLAISNYKRAVHELEFAKITTNEEDQLYTDFMKKVFLNLAICYNKEKNPRQALKMIEKLKNFVVIETNPKALYQEGKAYTTLGEFTKARASLTTANRLVPDDENIIDALQKLDIQVNEDKKNNRIFAQNALRAGTTPSFATLEKNLKHEDEEETKQRMKSLLVPFVEGETFSLHLPNDLVDKEIHSIQDLEEELRIKLVISNTSIGPEYKIMKTIPTKQLPMLVEEEEDEEM